jgi:monoamine oxidase
MKNHCVVIGSGLAGLAAGYRLIQNGWTVEVLEAHKKRVGGRVLTGRRKRKGRDPLVFELGGEWIGNDHDRMIFLCAHFHLPLLSHQFSFRFWLKETLSKKYLPGTSPFSEASQDAFAEMSERIKNNSDCENEQLDQMDWWTQLKKIGFTEEELSHRDLMDSTDFGESIRHTGAFVGASEYISSDDSDEMDWKVVGGNDRLPEALKRAINNASRAGSRPAVHMDCKVAQIQQSGSGVVITTQDGREFRADACVCAIPAHGLAKIKWDPPLPDDQSEAAMELQYARIMKTAVYFRQRFWEEKDDDGKSGFSLFTNRASDYVFDSSFGQDGPEGILCSYAIGDKADDLAEEKSPEKEVPVGRDIPECRNLAKWIGEDVQDALRKLKTLKFPNSFLKNRKPHGICIGRQPWQEEEAIGGAYAFYRPGQWFRVRPILLQPHWRVLFAGEHLSDDWQGFMEGAVETGQDAADLLTGD